MSLEKTLSVLTRRIYYMAETLNQLESKVELLEHSANQQSILVDTLGTIMEELKKQEP